MSRDNDHKRKYFLKKKYGVTLARTKAVIYIPQINVQLSFLKFNSLLSATSILSRSPMAYNTTETWTNWLVPTMWTLASVKTYLDNFLGPKMTPTTWIST